MLCGVGTSLILYNHWVSILLNFVLSIVMPRFIGLINLVGNMMWAESL